MPELWWLASTGEERALPPGFMLVSVDEDAAVLGFVLMTEVEGVACLEQLSVRRSQARRGWGRAFVEATKSEGTSRGYSEITLRAYAKVPWNAPFHATVGFRPSDPNTDFHEAFSQSKPGLG